MPIYSAAFALMLLASPVGADGPPTPAETYAQAERALGGGDVPGGARLLEQAFDAGSIAAGLRLAALAESGAGAIPRDPARAVRLVSALANTYADADRYHPDRRLIAEAFRRLAAFHASGVPEAGLARDPGLAARLRYQAAVSLGDAQAQYEIGRMYLEGEGVTANMPIATMFLTYAARARHAAAQAIYGNLIFEGRGVKRQAPQGLALLALAYANADDDERGWIEALYRAALQGASDAELALAQDWADQHMGVYRRAQDVPLRIRRDPPARLNDAPQAAASALAGQGH